MLDGRWICTMAIPIDVAGIMEYGKDNLICSNPKARRFVEKQRPSLTGKPFTIEMIIGKPQFRN